MFGMDTAENEKDGHDAEDSGDYRRDVAESSCFKLLNELSDLLMLPKDMLLENFVRKEVIPVWFLSHPDVLGRIYSASVFPHSLVHCALVKDNQSAVRW
jgi:hypothetical protein